MHRYIGCMVETTKQIAMPVPHPRLPFAGVRWASAREVGVRAEHLWAIDRMQRDERCWSDVDAFEPLTCMDARDRQQPMLMCGVPIFPLNAAWCVEQGHLHHVDQFVYLRCCTGMSRIGIRTPPRAPLLRPATLLLLPQPIC